MTRDQAIDWAIKRIKSYVSHPSLYLHASEASQTADALTALTNTQWTVKRVSNGARFYWRVTDTGKPPETDTPGNAQRSGSI